MHTRPKRESSVSGGWNSEVIFGTKFWNIFGSKFLRTLLSHTIIKYIHKHDIQRKQKCEHYHGARRHPCEHTLAKHASCRVAFARQNTTLTATPIADSRHNAHCADGIHYARFCCSARMPHALSAAARRAFAAWRYKSNASRSAGCQMHSASLAPHTMPKQARVPRSRNVRL